VYKAAMMTAATGRHQNRVAATVGQMALTAVAAAVTALE
jgi:hypothetical protein